MASNRLFSDTGHKVANLKRAVRPTVDSHRQQFRGDSWVILKDPFNNRFFRLRPEAWAFIARLTPNITVESLWLQELERNPEQAPGQEDVVEILIQLNQSNLLYFDNPSDSARLFQRKQQREHSALKQKFMSFISIRLPLLDPDYFLKQWTGHLGFLISWPGMIVWLCVVLSAIIPIASHAGSITNQVNGILAPSNLIWLYLAIALVKVLHEFGHAAICRYYGGEVHTMGIMFIILIPLPYMDATSSWQLRSRRHRTLVGGAGMIIELFMAAIATWIWAYSAPGIVNSVAYNVMIVASLSTLLFNANPLLKFDGYYMLSDILDIPNLFTRSRSQLKYLFERYMLQCDYLIPPSHSSYEAKWMSIFAILSISYKLLIFIGITLFLTENYLLLGLIMAAFLVVSTLLIPPFKLVKYLISSPNIAGKRLRASLSSFGLIFLSILLFGAIPIEDNFRADGIVEANQYQDITSQTEGYIRQWYVTSGQRIQQGEDIAQLNNPVLAIQIQQAEAQLEETQLRIKKARSESWADIDPLIERQVSSQGYLDELHQRRRYQTLKAPISGIWVSSSQQVLTHTWANRGTVLGRIIDDSEFRLLAVVKQETADRLFAKGNKRGEVRLLGQEDLNLPVSNIHVVPVQHQKLPSAALGWQGGGNQAVDMSDEMGTKTQEPFFLLRAKLPEDILYRHGQSAVLLIITADKPLLTQWYRKFQQLLQKRFLL